MKILKDNYEKVILVILLCLLLVGVNTQFNKMKEIKNSTELMPPTGNDLEMIKRSELSFNLKVASTDKLTIFEKGKFYYPGNYVFCKNPTCNFLLDSDDETAKCFVCDTPFDKITNIVVANERDTDNAGIPDTIEATIGTDFNDPKDEYEDKDNDGFTNLQEYLYYLKKGTFINAINENATHPPLIKRVKFRRIAADKLNFILKTVIKSGANKAKWDIQMKIKNKTRYLRIGDQINDGYKILDVEYKVKEVKVKGLPVAKEISSIKVQKGNEAIITVPLNKRVSPPNQSKAVFTFYFVKSNGRKGAKTYKISLGDEFVLNGKGKNEKEIYVLRKMTSKYIKVFSEDSAEEFKVGRKIAIPIDEIPDELLERAPEEDYQIDIPRRK